MTDNTQELDEILVELCKNTQADYGYQKLVPSEAAKAKQSLLDWHNKQVVQAELDILNHLLRVDKTGDEPSAHLIRLRTIQMQGSAKSRLSKGKLRRAA